MELDRLIEKTADPEATANRLQTILEDKKASGLFDKFDEEQKHSLIKIIGISRFLTHFLQRNPESLELIGTPYQASTESFNDVSELRRYKYRSLLQITWMDVCQTGSYKTVLENLSKLADKVIQVSHKLVTVEHEKFNPGQNIAVMGMGKLGANELNYSSDVDLTFVLENENSNHEMHEFYTHHIHRFCRLMTENSEDGFLYRVDLNLRPWGRSAPLVFSLDDYEEYYQASKEAWERIAWLRGRFIAGAEELGQTMLRSLKPFVFHKNLSAEDIERFLKIKSDMAAQRNKEGHWNIKLGEGGIRDIEFFVHILQIINGAHHRSLRITNTLEVLEQLKFCGLINADEEIELRDSYLFLRRLENRLQMIDEQQTHQLPHDKESLKQIAVMMGYDAEDRDQAYASFNDDLILYQQVARKYFEKLLADDIEY